MAYDLSKLLIPFDKCPRGMRLIKHFPELAAFPQFVNQKDDDVIKIAILTADQDSPFWKLRSDREAMIKAIFEFLDLSLISAKGRESYRNVVEYKHQEVSECWAAYLQMQFSIDFTDWAITKETYDMLIVESTRPREEGEEAVKYADWRIKIRNHIRTLGSDLKAIEPKIFKDSKMVRPVAIEEIKIKNYPEKYAMKGSLM